MSSSSVVVVKRIDLEPPHGYLWIGTQAGLVRFDGASFVRWVPPAGAAMGGPFSRSSAATTGACGSGPTAVLVI